MGDNKRWFKVWTSLLIDSDMMDLTMEDRGRWVTLGAFTAHNGTGGVLKIKPEQLAKLLHLPIKDVTNDVTILREKIACLPNVKISDSCNGTCVVTFVNWHKYQVDSTSSDRVKNWRNEQKCNDVKKRREEKRKKYSFSSLKENKKNTTDELKLPLKEKFQLPEWVPKKEWDAFVEMRKRIRKPLTENAKELAVRDLERLKALGHPPADVLNRSTFNSWTGLYEIKQKKEQEYL